MNRPTSPKAASSGTRSKQPRYDVVFLGDSLTAGFQLARSEAYPAQVQRLWKQQNKPWVARNAGVSGDTSAGALSRLNWVLTPRVHTLFIAIGGNDGLRGFKLESTRKNILSIIRKARRKKIRVILAGIQIPTNYGPAYTKAFRSMYR
ncbi:MAG: GDSL-type esterase/lipase family protein, partial [Myxococcota bacterium]